MHYTAKDLRRFSIYVTKHGSHAYGLNTPSSDLDIKGVFVAPRPYYLGFQARVEQIEEREPNDLVIYEIRKFFALAADCNPNIIEVLHTDESDILWPEVHGPSSIVEELRAHANDFVSTKAKHTFSGYAMSQLKRIRAHYRWLKDPPKAPPTRAEFGLPEFTAISRDQLQAAESLVKKKIDSWMPLMDDLSDATKIALSGQLDDFLVELAENAGAIDKQHFLEQAASRAIGYDENFLMLLDKERRYAGAKHEWDQFQRWKKERNEKRAALEAAHGYDTKHAMHLVRLMRMGEEILTTGKVIVKRPDREELLAIRAGAWKYDDLIAWATAQDAKLSEIYTSGKSPLPKQPDRVKLDQLCMSLVERSWSLFG